MNINIVAKNQEFPSQNGWKSDDSFDNSASLTKIVRGQNIEPKINIHSSSMTGETVQKTQNYEASMDDLFSQTKIQVSAGNTASGKLEDSYADLKREFSQIFGRIQAGKHRYEVFRDFVFCSAAALRNAMVKVEVVEEEYLQIINTYDKTDQEHIARLLGILVMLLEFEPRDVLGELYMDLEIASKDSGQFFTPQHVSDMMAQMTFDQSLFETQPFVRLSEPASGAGGMILAFVKVMLANGINPKDRLFVEAVDIDRNVALMCYIQLALWHVPARILVGDTLTQEFSEVWYTPAYFLERWEFRLAQAQLDEAMPEALELSAEEPPLDEMECFPEPEDFADEVEVSGTQEHELRWRDELLRITWTPEKFSGMTAHLEIRVEGQRPIPITETGYKSHFCPREVVEDVGGPVAYVQKWLEELDDGKPVQLDLF